MKSFSEYYEEKETEQLNEEALTAIIGASLALPAGLLASYFASRMTYRYAKVNVKIVRKIVKTWEEFKNLFKRQDKEKIQQKIEKTVEEISNSPEAQKANRQADKLREKYSNTLSEVYEAIENGNQEEAKDAFLKLGTKYQNNPEINTAILDKIFDEYDEPPIHVSSPGNETYQMIKKILGQKIAKSAEAMTRESFKEYYDRANEEEE